MLVNISYSIDFEEVPKVVRGFLQEDIKKNLETGIAYGLEGSITSLEVGEENIGKAIKHIDEVRDLLVKLDVRLLDCSSILRGYQQELISPPQGGQPSQPEDLSSLQENISKLREKISGGNNETESG